MDETLALLDIQAKYSLLTAKIQSLTSRIQGYEAQINMVAQRRTFRESIEDQQSIQRMRGEQHRLYEHLDCILNDLKIGTKDPLPSPGTYSIP